jgi:chromosome segregation ATPase
MKKEKSVWWLIFFQKRDDQKDNIADVCLYYLVLIELHTKEFPHGIAKLESITKEVMNLVQKLKQKVAEEDDIKKGIFSPVGNYLIVDKLRTDNDKVNKKNQLIQGKLTHSEEIIFQLEEKLVQSEEKLVQSEEKLVQSEEKLVQSEEKLVQSEEKLTQSEEERIQLERENQLLKERLKQFEKK